MLNVFEGIKYRELKIVFLAIFSATQCVHRYEGESNENRKTEIKIRNIAPLSYKLADMLPML
jgi:hypothetical protein